MKLLLLAYPRRWRERYGDEFLALLEAQPLTWCTCVNVLRSGLGERLRAAGPPPLRVLWAWSLFVIGGMAFQKSSEHWQTVVPSGGRGLPTVAFDIVQAAAIVGGIAVLAAVVLAFPTFVTDLRDDGWTVLRRPILTASATTAIAAAALIALALGHGVGTAAVFVAFAVASLFAWTYTAAAAARRLPLLRVYNHLALIVSAAMLVMTIGAAVWLASVTAHSTSFVGAVQLAVIATFMLAGNLVSVASVKALRT